MFKRFAAAAMLLSLLALFGADVLAKQFNLGVGDVIRVTVYNHPDLSSVKRIAENGTVNFPFIGEVALAGMSERQAELELAKLLERSQIVRSAQVNIVVEQHQGQRVSVLGNVVRPGVYNISRESTLVDLLAEAGGLTEEAARTAILSRGPNNAERFTVDLVRALEQGDPGADMAVSDGDRIFVPAMPKFYIYGQVNRPNTYRLEPGMTVMQAISVAGGLTERATERGITIKRAESPSAEPIALPADVTSKVQENDVIFVKESLF
jgi:polysaccharide biosynthesis/export protein